LESRGALLGFAIGVLAVFFFSSRPGLVATGLVLAVAVYALPGILPDRILVRFESTFADQSEHPTGATAIEEDLETSAATRIKIWKASLTAMLTNPLGFGFNSFQDVLGEHAQLPRDAHNIFVLMGVELGLAGLVLVIMLFARIGKDAWTVARAAPDPFLRALGLGVVAMVLAAVVVNCFGSRLMQLEPSTYLWILGGMMARARTSIRRPAPAAGGQLPAARGKRVA
jgi:O-antigen ligase